MTNTANTPREHDEQLAAKWHEIAKAEQTLSYKTGTLFSLAGARYYYRGRKRVTDMTVAEAIAKVQAAAEYIAAYIAEHTTEETGEWQGRTETYTTTNWDAYEPAAAQGIQTYEARKVADALAEYAEASRTVGELMEEAHELEAEYTGWSRFFLVTSSAGHVHSSRSCSTCRPTTTYGWLPQLSGKTEAEAVKELGPTLCSVCFPSAPVDWTTGRKITAAQAAKRAA